MTALECPIAMDVSFGRRLVAALGGNPSAIQDTWCWRDFGRAYAHLRPAAEAYFAAAQTGDPAWAAYSLTAYCGSDRAWAEGVVERAQTGDPAWVAYLLTKNCGSDRAWAEGVVERAQTGDPAEAAYRLLWNCGSNRAWAEGVAGRNAAD